MSNGLTRQVTVNAIADTQIVATIHCAKIVVKENPLVSNWPTSAFTAKIPSTGTAGVGIPAGGEFVFKKEMGIYAPGESAGYLILPSGSTTMDVHEGGV